MKTEDYFREKLEREVELYGDRARRIDDKYIAQVDKLAKRTPDPVLASYFRETVRRNAILAALDHIRLLLQTGELIEADKRMDQLRDKLLFVEQHLQRPYFTARAKSAAGGIKGAQLRAKLGPAERDGIRKMFDRLLATGKSKAEAEELVGQRFKCSDRWVRAIRRGK